MSTDVRNDLEDCWYGRGIYQPGNADLSMDKFLARYVIIPRSELPEVKRATNDTNMYYTDKENVVFTCVENARMWVMRDVAVWQFIESEATEEAAKTAARAARRNELAREFEYGLPILKGDSPLSRAIDRIIELESKA